jgi:hypothetical protein
LRDREGEHRDATQQDDDKGDYIRQDRPLDEEFSKHGRRGRPESGRGARRGRLAGGFTGRRHLRAGFGAHEAVDDDPILGG